MTRARTLLVAFALCGLSFLASGCAGSPAKQARPATTTSQPSTSTTKTIPTTSTSALTTTTTPPATTSTVPQVPGELVITTSVKPFRDQECMASYYPDLPCQYWSYVVMVSNPNQDVAALDISMSTTFVEADGTPSDLDDTFVAPGLGPNETFAFADTRDLELLDVKVTATPGRWEPMEIPSPLEAGPVSTYVADVDTDGGPASSGTSVQWASFQLAHTGSVDASRVVGTAVLYDGTGNILGGFSQPFDSVPAGTDETAYIRGKADQVIPDVAYAEVYLYWPGRLAEPSEGSTSGVPMED